MREPVSVAGRLSIACAIEQRRHGEAELLVELTGSFGIVLRDDEHARGAVPAAVNAFEKRQRVLAGGAGTLEECEENRPGFEQFDERVLAVIEACQPEIRGTLSGDESLVLFSGSHKYSVNRGCGLPQNARRVQAHSSFMC